VAKNNEERAAWLQGPPAQCEAVPNGSQSPWRLVLLGAPGVGKGTQANLLRQQLGACHLSTGDVFRTAGSLPECEQSPAMRQAIGYMQRGELVPDSTVWELVCERKACLHCNAGFILDGFPRTIWQAQCLKRLLEEEGIPLTAVINYELPASEIVARLGGRRTCEKCKAVYHVTEQPPHVAGACDRCGSNLFQREDDRLESVQVRLQAYERSTAPLIEFYYHLGVLVRVAATGSPDQICKRTFAGLNPRPAQNHV